MKDPATLRQILADLGPEYELVRELGRGTTAVVYLVIDRALGREVALKVIRSSYGHDDEAIARLQREARLVAQLQHPNIVKLYGTRRFGDGGFVLLMEHVPGRNLKEVVREEGALPVARVVRILRDVASALAYAHRRRIVHRDVKPENIYIDDEVGTARLADFGVARFWDRDTRLTLPGESLGTPAYMSPEQIDNAEVDGRTDVYSLGLVGYEMLVGEHPWESENLYSVIFKQKNEELPDLTTRRPGVPAVLAHAIARALRKDPEERWESAEAFLDALSGAEGRDAVDPFARAMGEEPVVFGDRDPGSAGGGPPPDRPAAGAGSSADQARPATEAAPRAAAAAAGAAGTSGPAAAEVGTGVSPGSPTGPDDDEAAWGPPRGDAAPVGRERDEGALTVLLAPHGRRGTVAAAVVLLLLGAGLAGGWWYLRGRPDVEATVTPDPTLTPFDPTVAPGPVADGGDEPDEGPAPTIRLAESSPLTGMAGDALPVVVEVTDAGGEPLAGQVVRFRTEGPGELVVDSVTTGADGSARTVLRLPESVGPVTLLAAIPGREADALRVEMGALSGPPAALQPLQGDGQDGVAGQLLRDPLAVRVLDALGNPVGDIEVAFRAVEGSGTLEPARARTDSLGRAFSRWRMGPEGGEQRAEVVVPSTPGVAFDFVASVEGPAQETGQTPLPGEPAPTGGAGGPPPTGAPAPSVAREAFTVGGTFACRLGGGDEPRCRGANDRGQVRGGGGTSFVAVAAGVSHACGLDAGGMASCWGANESGQLGDGSREDRAIAVPADTPARFARLAAGLAHTCAVDGAGRPWCWGRNLSGQLGDGGRDDHAVPRPVTGDVRLRRIVAGWNHTCGLDGNGVAWCWGLNADGQLGDRSRLDRLAPTRLVGAPDFGQLAAGSAHTCGLSGGTVFCWGDNAAGQLGDGTETDAERPVAVGDLPGPAAAIAAGAVHTCALLEDGRVFCWGQNLHGQLGAGEAGGTRSSPMEVAGGFRFRSIEAGGGMTCGITEDGAEMCWGLNQSGQLGDGSRTNQPRPSPVGG